MTNIEFGKLIFTVDDNNILGIHKCYGYDYTNLKSSRTFEIAEFDIAGGSTSGKNRSYGSEVTRALRYVGHTIENNVLTLVQRSEIVEMTTTFTAYDDTDAVRVVNNIKNITDGELCLELANTIGLHFGHDLLAENKDWYFHRFTNYRYAEAMPDVRSLYDMGMYWVNALIHVENVGNASSIENLPQAIIENRKTSDFLMFQIESYDSWFYEMSFSGTFNIHMGGPTARRHNWNKVLEAGESYTTVPVALAHGNTLNEVVGEMTKYRRHIKPHCPADEHLPSIYNEYMHFSWDDPNEERARTTAPYVAKTGCEYYVIDCGWHNSKEITGSLGMYKVFGTWYEDRGRFPNGIKALSDYMRSIGLKFGLWIAPEVVGSENYEMLEYYGDECFIQRNGKKVYHGMGYLLDFRHPKVYDYMSKTIDRMIDEYGCDYIKFDGCPNAGFGTELNSTSMGDGLEEHNRAFLKWTKDCMERHPNVIFEDCHGGGQRIDYKALSMFQLVSTSDQTRYDHYPYIAGNICASVLPEQAAVWSYPVANNDCEPGDPTSPDRNVSKERVVINMVNALLGRIHLASRIFMLDEEKQALIKEGIDVYNRITPDKLKAVPYLPKGYTMFGDKFVASGLKTDEKVYLAVWNLKGMRTVKLDLPEIKVADISSV